MDLILSSIIKNLKNAVTQKEHPFRYFTLATTGINRTPRLRTVVLREIDENLHIVIYTDKRSKKVTHITEQNTVSLLFLDREKQLQVTIRAKAYIIPDSPDIKEIWEQIPEKSRKEYTTKLPPGEEINNPEKVDFLEEKNFFTAIRLIPNRIEYLKLNRPTHIRMQFKKVNEEWKSSYLVP